MRAACLAFVVLVAAGCATGNVTHEPPAGLPTDEAATAAGLAPDEAFHARQLYLFRCGKCHQFYNPRNYAEPEWNEWMRKMSRKAHLNADESVLLARYLEVFRRTTSVSPPAEH